MQKKLTQLFLFIFLLVALWQGQQWWQARQSVAEPSADLEQTVPLGEALRQYSFSAESDGQSAIALVDAQVELELKEYDFGLMVQGVNGLMADAGHYWALRHNGEYAMVGIADLELAAGDQIELIYEEIVL